LRRSGKSFVNDVLRNLDQARVDGLSAGGRPGRGRAKGRDKCDCVPILVASFAAITFDAGLAPPESPMGFLIGSSGAVSQDVRMFQLCWARVDKASFLHHALVFRMIWTLFIRRRLPSLNARKPSDMIGAAEINWWSSPFAAMHKFLISQKPPSSQVVNRARWDDLNVAQTDHPSFCGRRVWNRRVT
jgi:hypothetical protein